MKTEFEVLVIKLLSAILYKLYYLMAAQGRDDIPDKQLDFVSEILSDAKDFYHNEK